MAASDRPTVPPLDQDEEAFFRAMMRVLVVLPRVLDADLVAQQHISATEYVTLMHLSEATDRQLRMSELAEACDLSLSGMTRVVARLESDGFVARRRCLEDARGWNAQLTPKGLGRLEEAYPVHLASVRRRVIDHMAELDLAQLAVAFEEVASQD